MTRSMIATLSLSFVVLSSTAGCGRGNSRVSLELGRPDQLLKWETEHDAKELLLGQTPTGGPVANAPPPQTVPQQVDPLQLAGIIYRDASIAALAAANMLEYCLRPMAWAVDPSSKADQKFFDSVADELSSGLHDIESSMKEAEPWDQLEELQKAMATLRVVATRCDREFQRRSEFEPIRSRIPDQFRIVDEMCAEWGKHVGYVYTEVKQFDNSPSAWSVVASFATGHDFSEVGAAAQRFRAPTVIRPVPTNCYQRFLGMAGGGYRGFDARSVCRQFTGVGVAVAHGDDGTSVSVGVAVQR